MARPAQILVTNDVLVLIWARRLGVLGEAGKKEEKGRLQPGKNVFIETRRRGRHRHSDYGDSKSGLQRGR